MKDLVKLSKTLAYTLRHNPAEFGITLDEEGWTPLTDLLDALHGRYEYRDVSLMDMRLIQGTFDKKRFEIDEPGNRIRAYYGHSVAKKLKHTSTTPPPVLYHGTSPDVLDNIMSEGLKPMSRQHVHLSTDIKTARKTGSRKHHQPVILKVDAQRAAQNGVKFYVGNQDVWLSEPIPAEYISE